MICVNSEEAPLVPPGDVEAAVLLNAGFVESMGSTSLNLELNIRGLEGYGKRPSSRRNLEKSCNVMCSLSVLPCEALASVDP